MHREARRTSLLNAVNPVTFVAGALGGSIAGLLAARVLADAYRHVTVVDRDDLTPGSQPRRGAPQGRHIHALLAGGQQVLEQLFPGLTKELEAYGPPVGDVLGDARLLFGGHRLRRAEIRLIDPQLCTAGAIGAIGEGTLCGTAAPDHASVVDLGGPLAGD